MPAATEGMITDCRPSLRCSRTTAERTKLAFAAVASMSAATNTLARGDDFSFNEPGLGKCCDYYSPAALF